MDLDNFSTVLGILGAYFAILFVLSVSVETLLEPDTWFKACTSQPGRHFEVGAEVGKNHLQRRPTIITTALLRTRRAVLLSTLA
jgi:hypothetical protein